MPQTYRSPRSNRLHRLSPPEFRRGFKFPPPTGLTVAFTIGAEVSEGKQVTMQLQKDGADYTPGNAITLPVWLSADNSAKAQDTNAATTFVAVAPTTAVVVKTGLMLMVTFSALGRALVKPTKTGANTWYVIVGLPDGQRVASAAVTVAA